MLHSPRFLRPFFFCLLKSLLISLTCRSMSISQRCTFTSSYNMQRKKITTNNSDISTARSYMKLRQKSNKLLSFFPNISKNSNAPENHHPNTNSAMYGNTAFNITVPTARVSTSTSVSLSSSSTVSSSSVALEPRFHVHDPSWIPEYTQLRKYLSRYSYSTIHILNVFNHICYEI